MPRKHDGNTRTDSSRFAGTALPASAETARGRRPEEESEMVSRFLVRAVLAALLLAPTPIHCRRGVGDRERSLQTPAGGPIDASVQVLPTTLVRWNCSKNHPILIHEHRRFSDGWALQELNRDAEAADAYRAVPEPAGCEGTEEDRGEQGVSAARSSAGEATDRRWTTQGIRVLIDGKPTSALGELSWSTSTRASIRLSAIKPEPPTRP